MIVVLWYHVCTCTAVVSHEVSHGCVCALLCVCTDFGGSGEEVEVEVVEVQEYVGDPAYDTATTQLHKACIYTITVCT